MRERERERMGKKERCNDSSESVNYSLIKKERASGVVRARVVGERGEEGVRTAASVIAISYN